MKDEMSKYLNLIGKHVKLISNHDTDDKSVEYGVIVNAWYEDSIGSVDCYVALYGSPFKLGKPSERPLVYRYAMTSLQFLEDRN